MARAAAKRLHVWWGARADPCGPGLLASGTFNGEPVNGGVNLRDLVERPKSRRLFGGLQEAAPHAAALQKYSCRRRRARLSSHAHGCGLQLKAKRGHAVRTCMQAQSAIDCLVHSRTQALGVCRISARAEATPGCKGSCLQSPVQPSNTHQRAICVAANGIEMAAGVSGSRNSGVLGS